MKEKFIPCEKLSKKKETGAERKTQEHLGRIESGHKETS